MLGTRTHQLLYRVVLPAAMPSIFTGLRLGLGIAWVLVIVSEMLAVKGGLGYALWTAYQFQRMDLIIAAINDAHRKADPEYLRTLRRIRDNIVEFQQSLLAETVTVTRGASSVKIT